MEGHNIPPRERSALTAALNPSGVERVTIKFSALILTVRWLGQEDRSHSRNALVSSTLEIKMNVLLGRSPAGR